MVGVQEVRDRCNLHLLAAVEWTDDPSLTHYFPLLTGHLRFLRERIFRFAIGGCGLTFKLPPFLRATWII